MEAVHNLSKNMNEEHVYGNGEVNSVMPFLSFKSTSLNYSRYILLYIKISQIFFLSEFQFLLSHMNRLCILYQVNLYVKSLRPYI